MHRIFRGSGGGLSLSFLSHNTLKLIKGWRTKKIAKMEDFKGEWRPIPCFENKYIVSNNGKVVSLNFKGLGIKKEMSPWLHHGYKQVTLCINGKAKQIPIHRLVALAFIPNPYNLPIINHKDENPLNNRVDNLEWCTTEYNLTYGTAIKRRTEKIKVPILQMTTDGEFVRKFDSAKEAGLSLGVLKYSCIIAVCKGKQKTAYGYKWRYEDEDRYLETLQKINIREYQKNINYKQGGLKHSKIVCQFTLDGKLVKEFASCLIASKETGICKGSIQQNCLRIRKTTHGFIFKYKEDIVEHEKKETTKKGE